MNGARAGLLRSSERVRAGAARARWQVALGAFVAGLALSPAGAGVALAAAAATVLSAIALALPRAGLACAALLVVGALTGQARLVAIDAPGAALQRAGDRAQPTRVDGVADLVDAPREERFGSRAVIRLRSGPHAGARLLARLPAGRSWPAGASPGVELRLAGEVRGVRGDARAKFDFAAHLRRQAIAGELVLERVVATGRRRGGIAGTFDAARLRAERGLASGLPERRAALARGLVLGRDEGLDAALRQDFRASGLAHLLAASGQNVMLLAALALPVFALAGLGHRARVVAVIALIGLYVPLAGASPSLERAGVMGAAGLVAVAAGRPASRVYALLLAAAVTLALNPRVSGDPGWQLSFAAVVGIVGLAPGLTSTLSRAMPRLLAAAIAVTFAATVATAPLLAHRFGAVPLIGLPANALALPAVAPVMWLGTVEVLVAQLPAGVPGLGPDGAIERALSTASGVPLAWLEGLAERCAELPGAGTPIELRSPFATVAIYALIVGVVVWARRAARRAEPRAAAAGAAWRRTPARVQLAVVVAALAALVLGVAAALAPPPGPGRLTVSFLDVGQGDATLIQHPDGSAILFDGGPPEARVVRRLRKAGVRRLSVVVATHASRDHHGGLREVIERYPVDLLLDGGDGSRDPAFLAVLAAADRRGVRRVRASAGLRLRAGALSVRVLSPRPRHPGPPPEDPNPRACIALVSSGRFDLLLSADAESPSLAPLGLRDVEAIKVPHHGSGDPGLPAVLRRLKPEVATIEVGADNGYGHPHPQTLGALRARVPHVYRTDRQGTVTLTIEHGRIAAATER